MLLSSMNRVLCLHAQTDVLVIVSPIMKLCSDWWIMLWLLDTISKSQVCFQPRYSI